MSAITEKEQKFKLIHGEFNSADAKEILFNIFNSKILFHKQKNFKSVEQTGFQDSFSIERQHQLIEAYGNIEKLLLKAEGHNGKLRIEGDIKIFLED
jgi:hypothetical protein